MKINIPVRMKNPWFWVGVVSILFTAMGVSPEMFTSWDILWDHIVALVKNPFLLGSTALSILGVFVDPTTSGVKDSKLAMTYSKPHKDE